MKKNKRSGVPTRPDRLAALKRMLRRKDIRVKQIALELNVSRQAIWQMRRRYNLQSLFKSSPYFKRNVRKYGGKSDVYFIKHEHRKRSPKKATVPRATEGSGTDAGQTRLRSRR